MTTPPRIVLFGATLTGNRGAESMLRAAAATIRDEMPDAQLTLLSLYPREDAAENDDGALSVIACSPMHLVAIAFPSALLFAVLRGRWTLWASAPCRAIADADALVDLSGISFVDGRGAGILLYNVLTILIPRLLGTRVVKFSQALGPFATASNRFLAKRLLPMCARVAARGARTRAHLDELGVPAGILRDCADTAFAMPLAPTTTRVEAILRSPLFARDVVAVSASSVVEELATAGGLAYVDTMVEFLRTLVRERGVSVLLLAHSNRAQSARKNNDLPVCREIAARAGLGDDLLFPDEALSAAEMRLLIGRCRFLVASRFHAVISGLAMGTPTMLIGWSHKYAEVMEQLELAEWALPYGELSPAALVAMFDRLRASEPGVRASIARHLPARIESARDNARMLAEVLRG